MIRVRSGTRRNIRRHTSTRSSQARAMSQSSNQHHPEEDGHLLQYAARASYILASGRD